MREDFKSFQNGELSPPKSLDHDILSLVNRELNPSVKLIATKLLLVHGFIGLVTMLFCPQFNLSLTNNFEAFHYFHHTFGEVVCNIICGSIFLGSGAVFASTILSLPEIRKVKKSGLLYYTALSILFVSAFFLFGVETYLSVVFFWMIGAIGSSYLLVHFGFLLRVKVQNLLNF